MAMQKPVRLELNNSGAWKLLGRFDAAVDDAAGEIMDAAEKLAAALNDPASGRTSVVTLRLSIDEAHPTVLARWNSADEGWRDAATGAPL
jgi:hypothetical protein